MYSIYTVVDLVDSFYVAFSRSDSILICWILFHCIANMETTTYRIRSIDHFVKLIHTTHLTDRCLQMVNPNCQTDYANHPANIIPTKKSGRFFPMRLLAASSSFLCNYDFYNLKSRNISRKREQFSVENRYPDHYMQPLEHITQHKPKCADSNTENMGLVSKKQQQQQYGYDAVIYICEMLIWNHIAFSPK